MRTQSTKKQSTPPMVVTVELPADFVEQLSRLSKMAGNTQEDIASELVAQAVEGVGDRLIAEDVMKKIESGEERTYTWEEACDEFGLAD